jgi:hypothetical protein
MLGTVLEPSGTYEFVGSPKAGTCEAQTELKAVLDRWLRTAYSLVGDAFWAGFSPAPVGGEYLVGKQAHCLLN